MRSLAESHASWLACGRGSPLFACAGGAADCSVYHALAPVLHDLGAWRSFESYRGVLWACFEERLARVPTLSLLVAGIDGESSARTLLACTRAFGPRVRVTFADVCATPLNRIRVALEPDDPDEREVRVVCEDLADAPAEGAAFDLVVADAFLPQFAPARRPALLRSLAARLGPGGVLVLREYFGELDDLLARDRRRMGGHAPRDAEVGALWASVEDAVQERLVDLEHRLLAAGPLYRDVPALAVDVAAAGLAIVRTYVNDACPDRVLVLAPGAPDTGA